MPDTTLQPGFVRFIQHRLPKLDSGNYNLTVSHVLGTKSKHETFETNVTFSVGGERFAIDPTDIDSMFPPAAATGEFYNVLPHLVLRRSVLPWIRTPLENVVVPKGDEDVASWLALLVIDQDDVQPTATPGTVRDLIGTATMASYLDAGNDGQPSDLEFGETAGDPCLLLDVDYGLFQRIAPSLADLNWLASVRVVSGQRSSADPDAPPGGEYALVMANRLPRSGKRTTVHLVSLEGMFEYLPTDTGPALLTGPAPATIRLVSLHQWSFDTDVMPETFPDVLEKVELAAGLVVPFRDDAPPATDVDRAIAAGFTGVDHRLRDGGRTVSWYRGPLAPYAVPSTLAARCPLHSADAALAVDPATGMLNVSYSAAWQLGRLMALSDTNFAERLFRWKHGCARNLVEADEHRLLGTRLGIDAAVESGDAGARAEALHKTLAGLTDKAVAAISGAADLPAIPALPAAPPPPDGAADMPAEVGTWIDRLRHLRGIPFRYLVPREDMLGPEAIRFFVLDPNWIAAAVDGAFSIGDVATGNLAPRVAQATPAPAAQTLSAISGFVLRSRAVKHWPGLQAMPIGADGRELKLLRYERMAEDTLLCLIDGIAATVNIHEPPEAIHFGVHGKNTPDDPFRKDLRDVPTGHLADEGAPHVPIAWRPAGSAILVNQLALEMRAALPGQRITSAEFTLLMIEGVGHVTFSSTAQARPSPVIRPSYGHGPAVVPARPADDPAGTVAEDIARAVEAATRNPFKFPF